MCYALFDSRPYGICLRPLATHVSWNPPIRPPIVFHGGTPSAVVAWIWIPDGGFGDGTSSGLLERLTSVSLLRVLPHGVSSSVAVAAITRPSAFVGLRWSGSRSIKSCSLVRGGLDCGSVGAVRRAMCGTMCDRHGFPGTLAVFPSGGEGRGERVAWPLVPWPWVFFVPPILSGCEGMYRKRIWGGGVRSCLPWC